jgi:hypothetical protein
LAFAAPHHNPKLLPNLVTIWCRPPCRISDSLKNPLKDWISGDSMISCPLKKRSKKPEKMIDTLPAFWDIGGTHGNNQNKNMRTKTLLITAAALVAGIASSNAQVYSANVVGYAQVVLNGGYNLIANPFDDGNGNHLTNLVTIPLPNKSTITTWNVGAQGYNGAISGGGGTWSADTILAPGTGFFLKNGTVASPLITNTFVGTVVAPVSSSVTNSLSAGYTLVGAQVPYATANLFTDTNVNLVNSGLAGKSSVTTWNVGAQGYNGAITFGTATPTPLAVGQGFFIKDISAPTNWVETLTPTP